MAQARRFDKVMSRYFRKAGKSNTLDVLEAVARRAGELGIQKVLVPSVSGTTALAAAKTLGGGRGSSPSPM